MKLFNDLQYGKIFSKSRLKTLIPHTFIFFFLGMFLFANKWITEKIFNWKYLLVFLILGGLGQYLRMYSNSLRIIDHIFSSLFILSFLGIIFKTNIGSKLLSFFKPVGRMALTNYIMQSIIASFVFYGIGMGLFMSLPLYGIFLIAFSILILQSIFSVYWLKKYHFGPLEWVWRTLSYNRNFSLKNKKSTDL